MSGQRRFPKVKKPTLYWWILAAWVVLFGGALYSTLPLMQDALRTSALVGAMVITTMAFIGYFWLNGMKDVFYTLLYHCWLKKRVTLPEVGLWRSKWLASPRVVMVYCTCNDFNELSLERSMPQNYDNFEVVILDDSSKPEFLRRIDVFAAKHGLRVIRRTNRPVGFKAGNLNNFLADPAEKWDFFVILDSDEVVPREFISRSLDYFAAHPTTGILQANHHATGNINRFMTMFARGVDSHWPAYQTVKDHFGFMSLLGHGAMASRRCYELSDGFPHVVAEDICFTIEARRKGLLARFAPDILCEEEFPVDYQAFTKRHGKWTEGNMEFILRNTWKILFSRMTWFEKLDIVLFTYSLPLTSVFSIYVVINVFVLPLMDYTVRFPLWMLAPTAMFLIAPMLNDIIFYWRELKKRALISYLLHSTILFGSMFFISLRSSIKSLFGKSVFHVTPKDSSEVTFWEAFRFNRSVLTFGVVLTSLSVGVTYSVFPVMLIVVPALSGMYLTMMHHDSADRGRHKKLQPAE